MLPLYLLTNAKGQQMSIELKNGEIIEGELTNVDNWMNLTLSNVTQYDNIGNSGNIASQKEIIKSKEIYLRGTYIKYIKLHDGIIDQVKQQINNNNGPNNSNGGGYRRNNRYNNNSPGGNFRRGNQNRRNYNNSNNNNNNNNSNRRPYQNRFDNQARSTNNGMGGYVQQHQPQKDTDSGSIEF